MQENLYQLIKDRRVPFPEATVRNMLYQVSGNQEFRPLNNLVIITRNGIHIIDSSDDLRIIEKMNI